MANEITEIYDYVMSVRGIYGRNRTSKFKTVRLHRSLRTDPILSEEDVRVLVISALAEIRFKSGSWNVDRTPVELERYPDGATIERFVLLSGERITAGVV